MRFPSARFASLAALPFAAAACNSIFGIEGGTLAGTGGTGGHGGAPSSSSTATSSSSSTGTTSSSSAATSSSGANPAGSSSSSAASSSSTGATSSSSSGGSCTAGTAQCSGSMLTVCDSTGHPQPAKDCGAPALCDPIGQVCETPGAVSLGRTRGCLVDGQAVYCWGNNNGSPSTFGTLVVGSSQGIYPSPTLMSGVSAASVAVADNFQCALEASGSVTCWGSNQFAQLGTPESDTPSTNTVTFPNNGVAVEIGVASACACARLGDASGSVWCWGLQDNGCLGDGTWDQSDVTQSDPVHVALGKPAVQLSIGDGLSSPSCARLSTGEVSCWGAGFQPMPVPGVKDATQVAVGSGGIFILRPGGVYVTKPVPPMPADGGMTSWSIPTPVQYLGPGVATSIAVGLAFCALKTGGGTAECAPLYDGIPNDLTMLPKPKPVTLPGTAVELTAGYGNAYASTTQCVRVSGVPFQKSVYCWGTDDFGELGVGGPEYPNTAQAITFTPPLTQAVTSVTSTVSSTNVTLADGSAHFWGSNNAYVQNGSDVSVPSPVLNNVGASNVLLKANDTYGTLYAMKSNGTTFFFNGGSAISGAPRLLGFTTSAHYVDIYPSLANGHADLGLLSDGRVVVYGDAASNGNDAGLFGDGTNMTPKTTTLKQVPLPSPASALTAAGYDWDSSPAHACAILNTGTPNKGPLYCWGSNAQNGESGVPGLPLLDVLTPTQVSLPGPVVSVSAGFTFTCATDGPTGTGQVYCWGGNDYGQLGNGTYGSPSPVPAPVQGIKNGGATVAAKGVSAGHRHACAWLTDGTVWCWGGNDFGQLGNGNYADQPAAVQVKGLAAGKTVQSVSAFWDHTCALYNDGTVTCWGDSYWGQVGNGYSASFPNPTMMPGLP